MASRQALASWYIYFFQLPRIPERVLLGRKRTGARLSKLLQRTKQKPEAADRDTRAMTALPDWECVGGRGADAVRLGM